MSNEGDFMDFTERFQNHVKEIDTSERNLPCEIPAVCHAMTVVKKGARLTLDACRSSSQEPALLEIQKNGNSLVMVFQRLTTSSGSVAAEYKAILDKDGEKNAVERLCTAILKGMCDVLEPTHRDSELVKELRAEITKLEAISSAAKNKDRSNFFNTGSGPQVNNTGSGSQNSNWSTGTQWNINSITNFTPPKT